MYMQIHICRVPYIYICKYIYTIHPIYRGYCWHPLYVYMQIHIYNIHKHLYNIIICIYTYIYTYIYIYMAGQLPLVMSCILLLSYDTHFLQIHGRATAPSDDMYPPPLI